MSSIPDRMLERLDAGGLAQSALDSFKFMYEAYAGGDSGTIAWTEISKPEPEDFISLSDLVKDGFGTKGELLYDKLAWVVLNGGLGTSMKMSKAKSLLTVKGEKTFLDLLAAHLLNLRKSRGSKLPLLFMDSFATSEDTLAALAPYDLIVASEEGGTLPLDFIQHKFPRIREADGLPYGEAGDVNAWAPPGHGDIYAAMEASGVLEKLLGLGIKWAFVSNSDNMGASPNAAILGYMAEAGRDFFMEVTPKTAADVKGGTLVRRGGGVELLEIAQVEEAHKADFQDVGVFPVFNSNNLWIDLEALAKKLEKGPLPLPLIVNRKEVEGVKVVQLESAMGAAIGQFDRAAGILIDRDRFAPVKTTDDLVVRRSDVYVEGVDSPLQINPARDPDLGPPVVKLDPEFYRSVPDLELRIPHPLGLVDAESLTVVGDVRFGREVKVTGNVRIENPGPAPMEIEDGSALTG